MSSRRRTYALVDSQALVHNLRWIENQLRPPSRLMAVVKANAYGHGAALISPVLQSAGVEHFGVATVQEAAELRQAGVTARIYVLSPTLAEEAPDVVAVNATPFVEDGPALQALADAAAAAGRPLAIHLKIDVGMSRFGVSPDVAVDVAGRIEAMKPLVLEGVATHFPAADGIPALTHEQWRQFSQTCARIEARLGRRVIRHAAASAATLHYPDTHADMVRCGLILYGITPNGTPQMDTLHPVLSLHTRVTAIRMAPPGTLVGYSGTWVTERPTLIATLGAGYGDGFARRLSNSAYVLLRNQRVRVVGRVCMDQMMVDATDTGAAVGDDVVIIGTQGGNTIAAKEIAQWMNTTPHEVTTNISARVTRELV